MNFNHLSDEELLHFRNQMQETHRNCRDDGFIVAKSTAPELLPPVMGMERLKPLPVLHDERLENVIYSLFVEAHNELSNRFSKKIVDPNDIEKPTRKIR